MILTEKLKEHNKNTQNWNSRNIMEGKQKIKVSELHSLPKASLAPPVD